MRRMLWILAPITLLAVAGVLMVLRLNHNAAAAPVPTHQTHEVAILFCVTKADTSASSIVVKAYDATARAPDIALGTSCAQALKTLLDADFRFEPDQVKPSDQSGKVEYTLIKVDSAPTPGVTPTPPRPTPGMTPTPGVTPTPGLTPTPLSVTTSATAKQTCASDFSHELTLSWQVTGARPPVSVTIEITGPDDQVETITDLPTEDTRTFQLRHPGGGAAQIAVVAKDASTSSSSAQASVQLGKCSSGLSSVRGSGNVTSEPREVSGFTAVALSGSGHLILEQTGTEALTITAEDNILPYLTSEVRGTQLRLGPKSNTSLQTTQEIIYKLTLKNLDALEVTGSGTVEAKGINTERLKITLRGSGGISVAGKAERQEIRLAGSGNYRGEDLKSQTVTIDIAGSGSAVLAVSDTLEANVRGSGSVEYVGDPVVKQQVSGSGSVRKQ